MEKCDLIVYYDGAFVILIKNVSPFVTMDKVLTEYAEKYGFDFVKLTGRWINQGIHQLDYNKDIRNG